MVETRGENPKIPTTIAQLSFGDVPQNDEMLNALTVGVQFITDFWRDRYFREFLKEGGSKIKFVTGQRGSGKTHTLNLVSSLAKREGYVTVSFSAKDIWLNDFREVYLEILQQSNILALLQRCSDRVVEKMGFFPQDIPEGMTFLDLLGQNAMADALNRREIRQLLKEMFLDNPHMDNNFALACSLICGGMLGHPSLEEQNRDLLLAWMHGDKKIRVTTLRPLGLAPTKITKYNARNMLRSLSEVVTLSGYSGLLVTIDNLEVLVDKSGLNPMHYTKMKREDSYESIRQLIDDIDNFKNIMFVFGFGRELLDNDNAGLKSYQALWMRIQNEIVGSRINKFTDIVDLDQVAYQEYSPALLVEMSRRLAEVVSHVDVTAMVIDEEKALQLIKQAKMGGISLPRLVGQATLGFQEEECDEGDEV
ncbi:MAG TPA: BREX system ATP-binding domain-containing protein [Sphaerochaeta sp.]|nr:BREX system ATP-binding domain-containing protein [Sphaerochaeta sp.]